MLSSSTADSGLSSWNMNMVKTSGVIHGEIVPPKMKKMVLICN